ncbi:MAG: hypothetical protein V4539_16990 [Bacteroidota bacterium]
MNIHYSKLATIVNAIESANKDDKMWIGMDAKIQLPTESDLHFFESHQDALDFQDFNRTIQKEVTLLPIIATLDFIYESADASLKNGINEPNVVLDVAEILELYEDYKFNYALSGLTEMMDTFDWGHTFYDPLEANTEAESFDDKIFFNRLEHFVEELSAFAVSSERAQTAVAELLNRHWKDQPMMVQIEPVLKGAYQRHESHLLNNKTNVMNENNFAFLKDNVKFTGFGEALFPELEKNLKEGKPEFQLRFSTQIGSRPFEAVLDFKKGNGDMYFYNGYKASVERSNGQKFEQYFQIEKGKGVHGKEAFNLLQGKAVVDRQKIQHLDKEARENLEVKPWVQLDFEKPTAKGFEFHPYSEGYGYNLKDAVNKFPVLEMDGGKNEKDLLRSLEKGNAQSVTMEIDGKLEKFFMEANPARKTINVYDSGFHLMKHQELPLKQEQAPKEAVAQENTQSNGQEQKQGEKKTNEQKAGKGMNHKKKTGKGKGVAIQ